LRAVPSAGIRKGADKSLAFPICITTERIFLGWVKEVRTMKSQVRGAPGGVGICRVNTFFNPVACCFLYKAKDLSAPSYNAVWQYHLKYYSNHAVWENRSHLIQVLSKSVAAVGRQ
jgi:hypothetical protein